MWLLSMRHLFCLALVLSLPGPAARAEVVDVRIDPTRTAQEMEGWGVSLAWWADQVGDWPDPALNAMLHRLVDPDRGLGLTHFRYNIGGGDHPEHAHMRANGDIPGFKPTPESAYDWDADARQRRVLLKLVGMVDRPVLEAWSCSPPWWMTFSGCSSGAEDGGINLRPEHERAFAEYLAEVVDHYRQRWGVTFRTLEPMNEPNASWWKANGSQEGCFMPLDQQRRLIRYADQALRRRNLPTRVAASDTSSIDTAVKSLRDFIEADPPVASHLVQFNTHSYFGDEREALRDLAAELGLRLWQSESGPLTIPGKPLDLTLVMADRIVQDLAVMQPTAWLTWQAIGGPNWGVFDVDEERMSFEPNMNFHMFAQFMRFVRPGDRIVRVSEPHVLAAWSPGRAEVVAVVVNPAETPRDYRLSVDHVSAVGTRAAVRRTSAAESFAQLDDLPVNDRAAKMTAPAQSITTVVFRKVMLAE